MKLLAELRMALRSLSRSPGHALVCVAMLSAGLGLAMYMFGAINAFLLRPLPFDDAGRLAHVELRETTSARRGAEVPMHEYLDLAAQQSGLQELSAFSLGTVNLSGDGRPERYEGGFVTRDLLRGLRVAPRLGRDFDDSDFAPGAPRVAILGHTLWEQRYAADPGIVGRAIRVNGAPATVIGVMPAGFRFPYRQDIWVPADLDVARVPRGEAETYEVIGRLAPGQTFDSVGAEYDLLLGALAQRHPDTPIAGMTAVVKPLNDEYIGNNTPTLLHAMMAAVVFVLLIGCANVANLMAARTLDRTRELAIHAALGADRGRLVLRVVAEGLTIALVAGAIGFVIAQWGGRATIAMLREQDGGVPFWLRYAIDLRSVAFACGVAVVTALVATLVPALRAGRMAQASGMREGGHGATGGGLGRFSGVLVAGEIALCAVLLVAAGLTVRSISAMQHVDLGVDVAGVLTARIALPESDYADDAAVAGFFVRLEERLAALPGVTAVAVGAAMPATFAYGVDYLADGTVLADGQRAPFAFSVDATPRYFDTFALTALQGRLFDARDRADTAPVAVVSAALAAAAWPGQDPVGRMLDLDPKGTEDAPVQVIGVVRDIVLDEPDANYYQAVYRPFAQRPARYATIALRSEGDPHALADPLRATLQDLDPNLPVYFVRTIDEWLASHTVADRLLARLFSTFAVFGVLLAGAGIYALLAFAVASRTREIGVRRALGARNRGIVSLVMHQGVRQLAFGLGIGLVLAAGFAQVLQNVLFGVSTVDPVTFGSVALVLAATVLIASWIPARRALTIEAIQALRYE
jgi:predicted permease